MLPQPIVEGPAKSLFLLDELFGQDFALLAYGPGAQPTLSLADCGDFGIAGLRKVAIVPSDYNPDPNVKSAGGVVRDLSNGFRDFRSAKGDRVILVRPDRYIAASATAEPGAIPAMADRVRASTRAVSEDIFHFLLAFTFSLKEEDAGSLVRSFASAEKRFCWTGIHRRTNCPRFRISSNTTQLIVALLEL